jgi:Transposase, Mutator family
VRPRSCPRVCGSNNVSGLITPGCEGLAGDAVMTATLDGVTNKKPDASAEAARELVRLAREQGLSLTGPHGLLKQLTKTVIALNEEITEHLGYEKHDPAGQGMGGGNVRNGTRAKAVLTEATGQVQIDVPRDRAGTFEPRNFARHFALRTPLLQGWRPLHQGPRHWAYLRLAPGCPRRSSPVAMQILRHSQISVSMEIYSGDQKRPAPRSEPAVDLGGRYWDRTSDLLGVNEALSR